MKTLKAFGVFWYEFIIGDDWKIAVAVVLALAATYGLMAATGLSDHVIAIVGAILVMVCFSVSLVIDVRSSD
jgi:hypothetical protein